jgi:hypothetical protein
MMMIFSPLFDMTTPDQIIESAKLAIDTYFNGEMKTKRKFSKDMEDLRAFLRDYESKQETVRLIRPDTPNPNEIF